MCAQEQRRDRDWRSEDPLRRTTIAPVTSVEVLRVSFWGTRGSISTPGRTTEKYGGNTACLAVREGNLVVVFDAGTGIRTLGVELREEFAAHPSALEVHLFLSHTHWDHIQGLPFFEPAYLPGVRLKIYGSGRKSGFLEQLLKQQMDYEYFPVSMSAFRCQPEIEELTGDRMQIGPFLIDWQEQFYHPGGSVRYRVRRGNRCLVYASDVELNKCFARQPTPEQEQRGQDYLEFIRGANCLVADGQYTAAEYENLVGFGHTSIPLVIELAYRARVRQLALFHHDPRHTDMMIDEMWREFQPAYLAKDPPLSIYWAREGMTTVV